jgi:2-keto-4-pentenoate hydratase
MNDSQTLAAQLLREHAAGDRFQTLLSQGAPLSLDAAYQVQQLYVQQLARDKGDRIAGYKIGLTSRAMQEMCGIDHPVHGAVLATRVHPSGWQVSLGAHGRLGIEFEIAVRLGRDFSWAGAGTPDVSVVASHVAYVAPAVELVDDRNADFATLDAGSLVADNAWNAGIVLGAWSPLPEPLEGRKGRLLVDGAPVDEGTIGAAADHPLASLAWLARELAGRGQPLRQGMVVMCGSIVRTRFAVASQRWRFEVDGLGAVEVGITA